MPSVLGFIGSADREQWLFPLWLRPFEQGSEVRELDPKPLLQLPDHSRLVADRESREPAPCRAVPRVPES